MDIFSSWITTQHIAHRGLHNKQNPENTLGAVQRAIDNNYAIEIDVRQIDDGTVVVFHDEKLSRLTGSDGYICNLKFEDLTRYYILGSEHNIPTLTQVLNLVDGKVPLLIEIKNNHKAGSLEKAVIELLKNYNGEFAIQSFNPYSLEYFYKNAPNITRGQLSSFFLGEKLNSFKRFALKRLLVTKMSRPDFIAYDTANLPNRVLRRFAHLPLLAWTVRTQEEYNRIKDIAHNIIFENFIPTT